MFHSTYTLMKIQTIHTESKYEYISKTSIFFQFIAYCASSPRKLVIRHVHK